MSYAPLLASSSPPLNRNLGAIFGSPNPQTGGLTLSPALPSVPSVGYNIPPPSARKRKQQGPPVDPSLSASPLDVSHHQQMQAQTQAQHPPHVLGMPGPAGMLGSPPTSSMSGVPSAPVAPVGSAAPVAPMAPPPPPLPQSLAAPPATSAAAAASQLPPPLPTAPSSIADPTGTHAQPTGPGPAPPSASSPPAAKKSRTNTPWTPAEEQRLKAMRDAGNSWSEIAKTFPTRTEGSVKKHWYKDMHYAEFAEDEVSFPSRSGRRDPSMTDDDDKSAALLAAIKDYENSKWKVIGQKVGKPAKACEQYAKEHFASGKH